jgi:hypothetical protein
MQFLIFTRYLNTDYVFLRSVFATALIFLIISYDIACQWHKKFRQRMKIFPHDEALSNSVENIRYLVPKFHLPAHMEACNLAFSFNLTKGVGRTDSEVPERGWANINSAAQSTKEMGPGSRRDTLDDHFGDWNWKKIIKMGKLRIFLAQPLILRSVRFYVDEENTGCGAHAKRSDSGIPSLRSDNPRGTGFPMACSGRIVGE